MILRAEHLMLVSGPDLETCERRVRSFFEKSQLVHYDTIAVDHASCMNGADPGFHKCVEQGVDANRREIAELLDKLKSEGCAHFQDIQAIPQGFRSKLLHTVSHLLDGFFGIDSKFFDIDEISHWITDARHRQIHEAPQTCWLIKVNAQSIYEQGFEHNRL